MSQFTEQFEQSESMKGRFLLDEDLKNAKQQDDIYYKFAQEIQAPGFNLSDCTAKPLPPDVLPSLDMGHQDKRSDNQWQGREQNAAPQQYDTTKDGYDASDSRQRNLYDLLVPKPPEGPLARPSELPTSYDSSESKANDHGPTDAQIIEESFDARAEADRLEKLGKNRLDTRNTFTNDATDNGVTAAKELAEEWARLTPDQRNASAELLTRTYNNNDWDALPIPEILRDPLGNAIGINFRASALDWNFGPAEVKVVAFDGQVTSSRMSRHFFESTDNPYITDFSTTDPYRLRLFSNE